MMLCCLWSTSVLRGESVGLQAVLQPLIDAHRGTVAVAVKHLKTGEGYAYRADRPMPTASLIKFPLMISAYRKVDAGELSLDQVITLADEDKVPGSGILSDHFSAGATFPLKDAIHLMIVYSDNTATNLVARIVGLPQVARDMESFGCRETKMNSFVFRRDTSIFPERSQKYGLGSTTAGEMIVLLEGLPRQQWASPASCADAGTVVGLRRPLQDRTSFARGHSICPQVGRSDGRQVGCRDHLCPQWPDCDLRIDRPKRGSATGRRQCGQCVVR